MLVETNRPGFTRGRNLEKIGMKAQDTSELFFDGVRVPVSNILGGEVALEWTLAYTKDRKAFGQRVIDFQHNRFKRADMAIRVEQGDTPVGEICLLKTNPSRP